MTAKKNEIRASEARDRLLTRLSKKPGTSTHVARIRHANANSWVIELSYVREASLRILMRYRVTCKNNEYEVMKMDTWNKQFSTTNFDWLCKQPVFN